MKKILLTTLLAAMALTALAQRRESTALRLPRFFADGMVLQRQQPIPVWGWGTPGQTVTVTLAGKRATTTVQSDSTWRVVLPRQKAGGPHELSIMGTTGTARKSKKQTADGGNTAATAFERKSIRNVLVGDVFLCSGQSNMELPIRRCMDRVADLVSDYHNDQIRYLKLPQQFNYVRPNDDVRTLPWQNITPQNCGEVSAICYFMARELQEHTGVPIGIINSAVGGTRVEAWMPHHVLETFTPYDRELLQPKYHQPHWPDSVRRAEARAAQQWHRQAMQADTILHRWRTPGYDFSQWQWVDRFQFLGQSGRNRQNGQNGANGRQSHNGSYWFRTVLNLPATADGQAALLRYGAIKDADSIFINGHCVGNTTYEYPPRVYKVPEGILRQGPNEIIVHLISQSGRPGFTRGKLYQLEVGNHTYTLPDTLQMAVGSLMPPQPRQTYFVDTPTGLYNAMIAPFRDLPLRGILWYQGESNVGSTSQYADLLAAMTQAWRQQLRQPKLPIVIMQLPAYQQHHQQPVETGWTQIRHQQLLAAQRIPLAALAPTLDTGEFNDIHPQDKHIAGHRAALQMRRLAYGEKNLLSGGPTPTAATIRSGQALLTFDQVGTGLTSSATAASSPSVVSATASAPSQPLTGFAILVDGRYQWAEARITSPNQVTVTLPPGTTRTTIRYAWDDYPHPTLYNSDGIPAPQFQVEAR